MSMLSVMSFLDTNGGAALFMHFVRGGGANALMWDRSNGASTFKYFMIE